METDPSTAGQAGTAPLETFLGGMETVFLCIDNINITCLETFLSGMETLSSAYL